MFVHINVVSSRKSQEVWLTAFSRSSYTLNKCPQTAESESLGPIPPYYYKDFLICFYINLNISVFWIHILIRSLFLLLSKTVIKLYFCILTYFVKLYTFRRRIKFISHSYFSWSLFFIRSASLSFVWASWSSLNRVVTWRFSVSTSLPTCHPGNHKHAFIRG